MVMMSRSQVSLDGNDVQLSVANPGFRDDGIGTLVHGADRPPKNGHLKAILVIEMDVHRRQHEVVVLVLGFREPPGQFALMMVVDVAETADAVRRGLPLQAVGFQAIGFQAIPQDVPDGLRTVLIALAAAICVEIGQQFLIERYGEPLHRSIPGC